MFLLLLACVAPSGGLHEAPADDTAAADTAADTADTTAPPDSGDTPPGDSGADTTAPDPCDALTPEADPAANAAAIDACLATGHATLAPGRFEIDRGIAVPAGAVLAGAGAGVSVLALTSGVSGCLLYLGGEATVQDLGLDGQDRLEFTYTNSIVILSGSYNRVSRTWIGNSGGTHRGAHTVGVYWLDAAGVGNVVEDSELYGTFYGAIFVAGLPAGSGNRLQGSTLHNIQCDSVTLVGYGEVDGNLIYENGWDCENGPIPGGGVYSLWNTTGASVTNNTVHDNCGHGIDLDGVANFLIEGNTLYDPGYTWGGWASWCGAAAGLAMMDVSTSVVRHNFVENNNRPWNGANSNPVFAARGASAWSDLPGGASAVMAAMITVRPESAGGSQGNRFEDNTFRAACGSGCVGVGYFLGRGTGYDARGDWSASTTNYLTGNDPYGSNVGSVRCGGNWYAASSSCPGDPECNVDDEQHSYDWSRNDGCYSY